MLLAPSKDHPMWFQVAIPTGTSLAVVAGIILLSIALSLIVARRESGEKKG